MSAVAWDVTWDSRKWKGLGSKIWWATAGMWQYAMISINRVSSSGEQDFWLLAFSMTVTAFVVASLLQGLEVRATAAGFQVRNPLWTWYVPYWAVERIEAKYLAVVLYTAGRKVNCYSLQGNNLPGWGDRPKWQDRCVLEMEAVCRDNRDGPGRFFGVSRRLQQRFWVWLLVLWVNMALLAADVFHTYWPYTPG